MHPISHTNNLRTWSQAALRVTLLAALLALLMAACTRLPAETSNQIPISPPDTASMANPAALYCQAQGGLHRIVTLPSGDQTGDCIFEDGSSCGAWAFFRGECQPGEQAAANPEPVEPQTFDGQPPDLPGNTADEADQAARPVVGWLGHITSLPDRAEYDDFIQFFPEDAGAVGIAGDTQALDALIQSLRDGTGVQAAVFIWGTLHCGVPDYGGCQVLVEDLQYGQVQPTPIGVDAWEGSLVCAKFNPSPDAMCDTAFVLGGPIQIQYGIWSADESILGQIERLRDSEARVRVWGQLLVGVPDVNGSQIQVNRLEISN